MVAVAHEVEQGIYYLKHWWFSSLHAKVSSGTITVGRLDRRVRCRTKVLISVIEAAV